MAKIIDPLKALQEDRKASGRKSAAQVAGLKPTAPPAASQGDLEALLKADFRQFLILLWQFLLKVDPEPVMLDMAWWMQHGPQRSVTMAFRGFSKSWITGAYALWRLYCDPQEKVLVVSGSLPKATANTNWCLGLIHSWPLLKHLQPKPNQRQSSKAFDVGPATPEQSPSFHALGIGGQAAGWRATVIIPDDVETAQNSITPDMRQKNADAVREFDSILKPEPSSVIRFLGTPHDEDSLYKVLMTRGYEARIWPALYPTEAQIKGYGDKLAPWVLQQLRKLGPSVVGHSTMPGRFNDDEFAKRRLSLGASEFALQFMLDTSLADTNRYPLKLHDLMVMPCDDKKAPDTVIWTQAPENRLFDLPSLGFEGDHYYKPMVPPNALYRPYSRIVGSVDNSGRGSDETALTIIGELAGRLYLINLWASTAGFEPSTLKRIADDCVRYRVNKLRIEQNFGDGMFTTLLRPIITAAWAAYNKGKPPVDQGLGTEIVEIRQSNTMAKERRILAVLEPVTQQHRLVVGEEVIRWDYDSLQRLDGEDTRHRYSLIHQLTHLTRERESLVHDDRLDSLASCIMEFGDILGVDPALMAKVIRDNLDDEELEKWFTEGDGDTTVTGGRRQYDKGRAASVKPQVR